MKKLLLSLTMALLISNSFAQIYQWAKRIGSANNDYGNSIAVDAGGNVYVTGTFQGIADFDPGTGTAYLTAGSQNDIFTAKYDSLGNYLWANRIGTSIWDEGNGIAVDATGNVYIIGSITGSGNDILIAKYGSSGNFLWSKSIGSTGDDKGYSIAVDAAGNVYITGYFKLTVDFDPGAGTANLTASVESDIFFAKYDANGNYIWANNIGGTYAEAGYSITVDGSSNVYITGMFRQTADFDPSAGIANLTSVDLEDVFFAKYDSLGNYLWAKSISSIANGDGDDQGYNIAVDAGENVYITGYFGSTADFDPGAGTANLTSVGFSDIFFAKYDPSGNYLWAKSIGDVGFDRGYGISVDAGGGVYVTGYFSGIADFDPGAGTANLTAIGSSADIFYAKFDPSGNYLWAKSIGSTNDDIGHSIAVDAGGYIYMTGRFEGIADFDPGPETINLATAGLADIFFAKYQDCGAISIPICLITVDTTSTKNVIAWEKPITAGIDSFKIYREIGLNNYVHISSVAYSALSEFTDTTNGVNPMIQSYRYKISVVDTCGNESTLSNHHRTIHLSTPQYTPPSTFDLIWTNDYEGFYISGYNILRDGYNTGIWDSIGSVTYGNLSYTDINAPSNNARYIIEAVHPTGCTANKKGKDYNSSISNSSSLLSVGYRELNDETLFNIYPNPNKGTFNVEVETLQNARLKVYDVLGRLLIEKGKINNTSCYRPDDDALIFE